MRFAQYTGALVLAVLTLVAAATEGDAAALQRDAMAVKIANRTVIVLRGPIAGYSAKERATSSTARIDHAFEKNQTPAISTVETADGVRVLLDGEPAFLVTRIDIDEQAGETTTIVAREAASRLQIALAERREQQTLRYLASAGAFALGATLLFATALWLIFRGNRWLGRRLSTDAEARARKLQVGGVRLLDASHVLLVTRTCFSLFAWTLALALATGWLTFVFEQFPYTRPWGEGLGSNLIDVFRTIALAIAGAAPGLLLVVVIFVIARGIVRVTNLFFERIKSGRMHVGRLDADTARPTQRIVTFGVFAFALAMAYPYLPGAQTEAFKGLSVLIGLMVSLGGASAVGQALSGLTLMYTRTFRTGDYVRIGDVEGTVVELGMFVTRIRTGMGEEITLPNTGIMSTSTKNYSRALPGTGYVVHTVVTIGYATPWRQVQAMLEEAARRTPTLATAPPPMVRQTALSDYYVEYRLIAYAPAERPRERAEVMSDLHARVQDVFNEYGVQIMSPHYMTDPAAPQVVRPEDWYLPPARPPEPRT